MHFDNLNGKLDSNLKFDYLFLRLLTNTQRALDAFNRRTDLSEGHRKIAILSTLGASLHMFARSRSWIRCELDCSAMASARS